VLPPFSLCLEAAAGGFLLVMSCALLTDNNCGGTMFPDGTRCIGVSASSTYLERRSSSSTHNGQRDIQFAVKFHW